MPTPANRREWTVKFWPCWMPVPRGWKLAEQTYSHHHRWSVILEKLPQPTEG